MARAQVLKERDLKGLDHATLEQLASTQGVSTQQSPQGIIHDLVLKSYPTYRLPKVRSGSVRGTVLAAFVNQDGTPTEGATDEEVVRKLLEIDGVDEKKAARVLGLYKRDLERYYGYKLVKDGERTYVVRRS